MYNEGLSTFSVISYISKECFFVEFPTHNLCFEDIELEIQQDNVLPISCYDFLSVQAWLSPFRDFYLFFNFLKNFSHISNFQTLKDDGFLRIIVKISNAMLILVRFMCQGLMSGFFLLAKEKTRTTVYIFTYSGQVNLRINFEWFALGGFDVESSHVLPALLQEGDQEVDTHVNVLSELLFSEGEGSDGSTHAKNLLKLESDS